MTKKDFKAIAEAIAESAARPAENLTPTDLINKPVLIAKLSRYFETVNPNFDPEKFCRACYE